MSYEFSNSNAAILSGVFNGTYGDPITIACHQKFTAHPAAVDVLVQLHLTDGANADSYQLHTYTTDNTWALTAYDTTTSSRVTSPAVDRDGVWTPVVAVITTDALRDIYVADIANTAQSTSTRTVSNGLLRLAVGRAAPANSAFTGFIAEVAVWNCALTTQQITDYLAGYNPSGIAAANLIGYFPLDYDSATQTNEGVDTAGDLTVTGTPAFSSDHPTILPWAVTYVKLTAPAAAASAANIEGVVLNAARDTVIGEFQRADV